MRSVMAPAETTTGLSGGSWPAPGVQDVALEAGAGSLGSSRHPAGGCSGGHWVLVARFCLGKLTSPGFLEPHGEQRDPRPRRHVDSSITCPPEELQVLRGSTRPRCAQREDRRARWACLSSSFSDLGVRLGSGGQVGGAFLKRLSLCRGKCPAHRRQVMGGSQP